MSDESWLQAFNRRGYLGTLELADNFGDSSRRFVWYLLCAQKLSASNETERAEAVLRRLDNLLTRPELGHNQRYLTNVILSLLRGVDVRLVISLYRKLLTSKNGLTQTKTLADLASALARSGRRNDADILFAEAERLARSVNNLNRDLDLCALSSALSSAQRFEEAERTARSIMKDPWMLAKALADLAAALDQSGRAEEATDLFGEVERLARSDHKWRQDNALDALSCALARAQKFNEAERIASLIEDVSQRTVALVNIVSALAHAQKFAAAERVARSFEQDSFILAQTLANVASALDRSGRCNEADDLFGEAERIVSNKDQYCGRDLAAIRGLISAFARAQRFEVAEHIARDSESFTELISELALSQRFAEAERIARSINNRSKQTNALAHIAVALVRSGKHHEADKLFNEIEQKDHYDHISHNAIRYHDNVYFDLARELINVRKFEDAERISRFIKNSLSQNSALAGLAAMFVRAQRFEEAERAARSIKDLQNQNDALYSLSSALSSAQMFAEAERVARLIKVRSDHSYSWGQTRAFDKLASALAEAQKFEEAERIARSIDGDLSRAEVLADVAAILSRCGRHEAADRLFEDAVRTFSPAASPAEGLSPTETIRDDYSYSTALAYVASKLAQSGRHEEADRLFDETIAVTVASYMKPISIPFLICKLAQSGRYKDLDRLIDEAEQSIRSNDDRESRVTGLTQLASALCIVQKYG